MTPAVRASRRPVAYQVFISHATADKWVAKQICKEVESIGVTTFRDDRDIDGGDSIPETILQQIKISKELLVLLTPQSVDRPWVLLELGAAWAWSRRIRIVPVTYYLSVDRIPEIIRERKAIDLNNLDDYLVGLASRI
jgi:hypothetical protein